MSGIICHNCGNDEFYREAGFFICKECHVQSAEVQDAAFQDDAYKEDAPEDTKLKTPQKTKKSRGPKDDQQVTSWEYYNYILLGLTEELISFGATTSLKEVVKLLWLRYLERLQVFKRKSGKWPRLQAVNSLKDAEIIYGKPSKRKRKKSVTSASSDAVNSSTADSSFFKKQMQKKRKGLVQAKHADFLERSETVPSIHNETLHSLQSSSDKVSKKSVPLSYNSYAMSELKKHQSAYHLKKHRHDFGYDLVCHKLSYRKITYKYRTSPYILSVNKIFAIVYLGLLINMDHISLGDLLRLIKEGHLGFNNFSKYLPKKLLVEGTKFKEHVKNGFFSNYRFRETASKLADFLKVKWYIPKPNLVQLCEKYCRELNLPDDVCNCATNIISRTKLKMKCKKLGSVIPNYEGRVISIILFTLKLFFGLDDVTEYHMEEYANLLNKSKRVRPEMFEIIRWLKYIDYRSSVYSHYHFPSNLENDFNDLGAISALCESISTRHLTRNTKYNKAMDDCRRTLSRLEEQQLSNDHSFLPKSSLQPMTDFTHHILHDETVDNSQLLTSILLEDFSNRSLKYLLQPCLYLKAANHSSDPTVVNGNANNNWVLEKLTCPENEVSAKKKSRRKFCTVELHLQQDCKQAKQTPLHPLPDNSENAERFQRFFEEVNKKAFKRHSDYLKIVSDSSGVKLKKLSKDLAAEKKHSTHFNPYERYWIRARYKVDTLHEGCYSYLNEYPSNFQLVFRECQKLIQQSVQDLMTEFQLVELYLAYVSDYSSGKVKTKPVSDELMQKCIDYSALFW